MNELEQDVYDLLKHFFPISKDKKDKFYLCQEYKFCNRGWRFDFAFPNLKIAVEVNGQTYHKGGHSSGRGLSRDYEKLNYAQSFGWTVFILDSAMTKRTILITWIKEKLQRSKNEQR